MFELTIKGVVYQFNFGMGFLREINKTIATGVDGVKDVKKNIGLRYTIALMMDGDVEALVDILDYANKAYNPRVTRNELDSYIESVENLDKLFEDVLDFLRKANATKKTVVSLEEAIEKEKAKETATA